MGIPPTEKEVGLRGEKEGINGFEYFLGKSINSRIQFINGGGEKV